MSTKPCICISIQLESLSESVDHFWCYGVVKHLANPLKLETCIKVAVVEHDGVPEMVVRPHAVKGNVGMLEPTRTHL